VSNPAAPSVLMAKTQRAAGEATSQVQMAMVAAARNRFQNTSSFPETPFPTEAQANSLTGLFA